MTEPGVGWEAAELEATLSDVTALTRPARWKQNTKTPPFAALAGVISGPAFNIF